jgi:hypothetical protein
MVSCRMVNGLQQREKKSLLLGSVTGHRLVKHARIKVFCGEKLSGRISNSVILFVMFSRFLKSIY